MTARLLRIGLALLLVAGITLAILYRDQFDAAALHHWVDNTGIGGPLLFMLIYALGTVFFLPGSVLTLAGGALFGPVLGTLYNLTAATIGATLAFLIARYLAADWVERKAGGRLAELKGGVEREGWRFVAFVRLVPLFPFNLLNYALGLTRIRLAHYLLATYICMLPGAIAYTYLGYAGREAIAGDVSITRTIQLITIALALLASVAFLPRLIAAWRRGPILDVDTLHSKLTRGEDLLLLDVRSAQEFTGAMGHIDGAVNIPVDQLTDRSSELGAKRDRAIAIVCHTDRRSAKAATVLTQQGYTHVQVVRGGMVAWQRGGHPVTGSAK